MLRYQARISVYKKDVESNKRTLDFPYDARFIEHMKEEIDFLIKNIHLVDDEGNIYVLDVANIEVNS